MADGAYCKECKRYNCHCALLREVLQMRSERDEARSLALQHLLEAWGDNPRVLAQRFAQNAWLVEIYNADIPRSD